MFTNVLPTFGKIWVKYTCLFGFFLTYIIIRIFKINMSKLRESIISNCEREFLLKTLAEWKRLDGRAFGECRELKIQFGKDWGSCLVSIGETRVLAQVSCEIQQPSSSRPSEGILYINLELNPLGAPHFEAGRQSDLSVYLNRHLETSLKDSKAVDLESLCIKVNEKVWTFRVDINVLNHEGNILDAASVAALAALAHFRRPDVTFEGEDFVVHTYAQRDPIPTVIHHYPVTVSYAIFNNGDTILADPTLLEEGVAESRLMLDLNAYNELCGIGLDGTTSIGYNCLPKAVTTAASRAKSVIEQIKKCIEEDNLKRQEKSEIGFDHDLFVFPKEEISPQEVLSQCLDKWSTAKKNKQENKRKKRAWDEDTMESVIEPLGENAAALIPKGEEENKWVEDTDDNDEISDEPTPEVKQKGKKKVETMDVDDSEEEEVVILNPSSKKNSSRRKR